MSRPSVRLPGLLLLVVVFAAPALAQPEPVVGGGLFTLGHEFSVKDGARVRIVNPYGDVRIREVPLQAPAELRVMVQTDSGFDNADSDTPNPARLNVEQLEDGIRYSIEAVAEGRLSTEQGFLRADFVIALPDRVEIEVEMDDGNFTMHPASYPVMIRGREGKYSLRTTGALDVELLDGHVVVQQGGGDAPLAGGRIQTSGAAVDVLGVDIDRVNYATLSGAAVTSDSAALLDTRVQDGRTYRFIGDPENPTLRIQTDAAPIRLVVDGIR